jgi:hypothetical protein
LLGDGWRDGDDRDGWLGDGWLGNGLRKGLAMDGMTAMQRRWNDPTAMDDSTATEINDLAMDGSAMDGVMAGQWATLRRCGGDGQRDGDGTLMEAQWRRQQ